MVQKIIDREVEEAFALGRQNQQTKRYLNWCKHLAIKLLSTSPLGQASSLPLGMHEIYCEYFSGSQSINVELLAESFISEHCADCPFHQELDPENQGRVIVQRVLDRRGKLDPALQARQRLKELVKESSAEAKLELDVTSDKALNHCLLLLEDPNRKVQAASKILSAAQELDVNLFSFSAVDSLPDRIQDESLRF